MQYQVIKVIKGNIRKYRGIKLSTREKYGIPENNKDYQEIIGSARE